MSLSPLALGHLREHCSDRVERAASKCRAEWTPSERLALARRLVDEPVDWLEAYGWAVRLRLLVKAKTLREGLETAFVRLGGTP